MPSGVRTAGLSLNTFEYRPQETRQKETISIHFIDNRRQTLVSNPQNKQDSRSQISRLFSIYSVSAKQDAAQFGTTCRDQTLQVNAPKHNQVLDLCNKTPQQNTYKHKKSPDATYTSGLFPRTLLGKVGIAETLGHDRIFENVFL